MLTVPAFAKINLTLDITGVREDGYHLLRSIMHTVRLSDILTVSAENAEETSICISTDKSYIPTDGKNTMYKAAEAFCSALGRPLRIDIKAEKHIPVGAGLGGGSSDAAALLRALNRLTGAGFSRKKLCGIGLSVGADVPYCIFGGTAAVEGIGELVRPLPKLPAWPLLICKPRGGASTPQVYREFDRLSGGANRPDNAAAESFVRRGDIRGLAGQCKNVLTAAAALIRPEIPEIKSMISGCGALCAEMSGSGSAVFGIFDSFSEAKAAADRLSRSIDTVILTSL